MKNFKNTLTGRIFKYIGKKLINGNSCFMIDEYSGVKEEHCELTDLPSWSTISFNCRLKYSEALDCVKHFESIGGQAGITVGGSYYSGNENMLLQLIHYMSLRDYDLDSLSFDYPHEATQRRIKQYLNK